MLAVTAHQRTRGKPFNYRLQHSVSKILFKPHKTTGPQQKLAVNWLDGCWLGFNTRTGEHIVSSNAAVVSLARRTCIPMVNPEVEARPTEKKTRNEENGRRTYITKKVTSEFGATWGCKGCLMIGEPHTEECRARITARMESDPAHAKRLEDNLAKRVGFDTPKTEVAAPGEGRTDATKRARQDAVGPPQESTNTGGLRAVQTEMTWRCDR